jgi:hypothetical protein
MYTNFLAEELCEELFDKLAVCACCYWLYIFVMSV